MSADKQPLQAVDAEAQSDWVRTMAAMAFPALDSDALDKDRRFDDPWWHDMPGYRLLGLAYLGWKDQWHRAVDATPLPGRLPERLHTMVDLWADGLAPTNTLAGNPAAIKKAWDTRGASLVSGYKRWLADLAGNRGMPSNVDDTGFEVGRNLAATPGSVVHRTEMFELIRYTPVTPEVHAVPCLYIPPQINRYYMIDLAPGRSFVEHAVAHGLQQFVVVWRNPRPEHADWGFDAYVGAIIEAVEAVRAISGSDGVHLAGSCTGGITACIAAAVLAGRGASPLKSLTLMVATIDTAVDTQFNLFSSPQLVEAAKAMTRARGVMDGSEMAGIFAWMRPNEMIWNHWVSNVLMGSDPPRFDMLVWNKDTTRLPAAFHADLLDLGTGNPLLRPGALRVCGTPVDLHKVTCPTYVIGGLTDHIAPWKSCFAAVPLLGGPSRFVLGNGGHIQSIIAPPGTKRASYYVCDGAQQELPRDADAWLAQATLREGSWWPDWTGWVASQGGAARKSTVRVDKRAVQALCAAPGTYVHER